MEIERQTVLLKVVDFLNGRITRQAVYEWALGVATSREFEKASRQDPLILQTVLTLIDLNQSEKDDRDTQDMLEYLGACLAGKEAFEPQKVKKESRHTAEGQSIEEVIKSSKAKGVGKDLFVLSRIYVMIFAAICMAVHLISIVNPAFLRFGAAVPSQTETILESLPYLVHAIFVMLPLSWTARGLRFYFAFTILSFGMLFYWFVSFTFIVKFSLHFIFILVVLPFGAVPATLALLLLIRQWSQWNKSDAVRAVGCLVLLGFVFTLGACGPPLVKEYNDQGQLIREASYQDGKLHGLVKVYDSKGRLNALQQFQKGKLEGITVEYFDNGEKKMEIPYQGELIEGLVKTYYDFGELKSEETYVKDVKSGITRNYDLRQNLAEVVPYEGGKIVGTVLRYWDTGELKAEQQYREGLPHGTLREYHKTGNVSRLVNFTDGVQRGAMKTFHSNGIIQREWYAVNGVSHGPSREFELNGRLASEGQFKNGKPDGVFKVYRRGRIDRIETYVDGKLISRDIYDQQGRLEFHQDISG